MKVLIINIDRNYRSIYTGAIAAALLKKIPKLEITGFLSGPNELFSTLGHFEKLYFFDTEEFFNRTKNLSNSEVEIEIIEALKPVKKIKWDVVINLSSNLLGTLFTNFIDYKEVRGTSLESDLENFRHSDVASYYLSTLTDNFSNFFHFTYLYRSMLKRFEEITLSSIWESQLSEEFYSHFESVKRRNNKTDIILIDINCLNFHQWQEVEIFANLYLRFHQHPRLLPVFIGADLNDGHPLLNKLKNTVKGEIYSLQIQNQAQISVMSIASLVITNDLYLKSVADISLKPSLFLTTNLNLSDYSIHSSSCQIVEKTLSEEGTRFLYDLTNHIVLKTPMPPTFGKDIEIYNTINFQHLPVLNSRFGGTPEYANWLLGVRFLASLHKIDLSIIRVNQENYKKAIIRERQLLNKKEGESIYSVATEMARAKIKNSLLVSEAHVVETLTSFYSAEEARP